MEEAACNEYIASIIITSASNNLLKSLTHAERNRAFEKLFARIIYSRADFPRMQRI